ncbi:MAG TPA: ChaB family protein [Nitriliruptorales bacterium]|nr:ChaB family protein [Nitriliruptorales bacterium]
MPTARVKRAHRTAYSALKHRFEKVGDHWEPKGHKGPSDERAARGADQPGGETAGGLDVKGSTKEELYERAEDLDVQGRSKMNKQELASGSRRSRTDRPRGDGAGGAGSRRGVAGLGGRRGSATGAGARRAGGAGAATGYQ